MEPQASQITTRPSAPRLLPRRCPSPDAVPPSPPAAALPAPAPPSAPLLTLPGLTCQQPRGKHDVAAFPGLLVLSPSSRPVGPDAPALVVPAAAVRAAALLPGAANDASGRVSVVLALAPGAATWVAGPAPDGSGWGRGGGASPSCPPPTRPRPAPGVVVLRVGGVGAGAAPEADPAADADADPGLDAFLRAGCPEADAPWGPWLGAAARLLVAAGCRSDALLRPDADAGGVAGSALGPSRWLPSKRAPRGALSLPCRALRAGPEGTSGIKEGALWLIPPPRPPPPAAAGGAAPPPPRRALRRGALVFSAPGIFLPAGRIECVWCPRAGLREQGAFDATVHLLPEPAAPAARSETAAAPAAPAPPPPLELMGIGAEEGAGLLRWAALCGVRLGEPRGEGGESDAGSDLDDAGDDELALRSPKRARPAD